MIIGWRLSLFASALCGGAALLDIYTHRPGLAVFMLTFCVFNGFISGAKWGGK